MRLYCLKRDRGVEQWRHEQPRRQGLRRAARGSRSRVAVSHVVGGAVRRRHAQPEARRDELRGVGQRHSSCSDSAPRAELHVPRASRRSAAEPPPAEPSARCSRQSQRTEKSCSRAVERRVDSSAAMSIWSGHASASSGPTHTSASRGANARRGEPPGSCSPTAARPAAARPCLVDGQQPHGR